MSVSVSVILDTRREKRNKKFPVKLRVRLNSKPVKLYPTIYELSLEDFNKLSAPRINKDLQKNRETFKILESKAREVISDIKPSRYSDFETVYIKGNPHFKEKNPKLLTVEDQCLDEELKPYEKRFKILQEVHPSQEYISAGFQSNVKRLLEEGRIGSALNYQDSYYALKRFRGNVRYDEITVSYLNQFERQLIDKMNRSKTTVGIKLRSLRAVFNDAIENGIIDRKHCYPFGRRKYQIPTSRNVKKALEISEVKMIYEHLPEIESDRRARDYWLFCYFCNGMNPKDMAHLKFKNIDGEYISFVRAKTEKSTRSDPKLITAFINKDMHRIINEWGNKSKGLHDYVFPILSAEDNLLEQHMKVAQLAKFICDGMRNVARAIGINKKAGNMECRHTLATTLKRSGASTEFIQEALGHTDKKTTENYLDSFEKEIKKEFSKLISTF